MAQTPEGKVKAIGAKIIKEYDPYYFCPVTGGFGSSGQFDVVILYKKIFIGIEYKADSTKRPTELQTKNAIKAMDMGAVVLLIHKDNLYELKNTLENIKLGKLNELKSVWLYGNEKQL